MCCSIRRLAPLPGLLIGGLMLADLCSAQTVQGRLVFLPEALEEARVQRTRAEVLKADAQQRYGVEQEECYRRVLVNDCLEAAKKNHTDAMLKARELDQAGRDVERAAHRHEVEAQEATRAADGQQRAIEQQAQVGQYRAEEVKKAAERERKLADKARQAAEGQRKSAAEQAARREKLAQRAKDDAERTAKKSAESGASTLR